MSELLDNPAVQAAALPFLSALAIGFLLAGSRYLAAGAVSGLAVVLALTIGFSLEPFTSVRKLMVSVLAIAAVAVGLEARGIAARRAVVAAVAVLAGAAAVWAIWRVLQQLALPAAGIAGLAAFAFAAALTGSAALAGAASSLRGAVVGAGLGWASGILALLGASALLAQIGLATGTACAALALVQLLRGHEAPLGWTLVLPAAATAALVGVLASATGELKWYCLVPLPLAPLLVRWLPAGDARPLWQRAGLAGIAAALPLVIAIGLARWPVGAASP